MIPLDLGARCLVVAEVGQAHDGSLGTAHAYIDVAARAGADAVKFQTHIAHAESTEREPWRVAFSKQDATRYDYWKRMEFTEPQWLGLREHADEVGLAFLSSPFSLEAVELLARIDVSAWKVASGEMASLSMLEAIAAHGAPVLLSSGMSPLAEVDAAVEIVRRSGSPLAVLQCTSSYPCPPERLGLNVLGELAERYDCSVGLSDHSGTIYAGLAAATLGADLLEVHVTLSEHAFGPDVPASLTVDGLRQLVDGVQFVTTALANPVDKDDSAGTMGALRSLFTKSLVARTALSTGHVLAAGDLTPKKPGGGMTEAQLPDLVGSTLVLPLAPDEAITERHLGVP